MKLCPRCGVELDTKPALSVYCSRACQKKAWRERTHPKAPRVPDAERFLGMSEAVDSGCREWRRATFGPGGYGAFVLGGKTIGAHRAAWLLFRGPIGDGLIVRHRCDNRPCVNLDHLELGTKRDNAQDAVARGRNSRGERHGVAKLSDVEVVEIRQLYAAGHRQRPLAQRYGVTQAQISNIVRGAQRVDAKAGCASSDDWEAS